MRHFSCKGVGLIMNATINSLRDEHAQETFLNNFAAAHPRLTGDDIDLAFRDALRDVSPSEPVDALEKEMERRLGLEGRD